MNGEGDGYEGTIGSLPWKHQSLTPPSTQIYKGQSSFLTTAESWLLQAFQTRGKHRKTLLGDGSKDVLRETEAEVSWHLLYLFLMKEWWAVSSTAGGCSEGEANDRWVDVCVTDEKN